MFQFLTDWCSRRSWRKFFLTFRDGLFGYKIDYVGAFKGFVGNTVFTLTLWQAEKFVGGGNVPSYFLGARTESVERGIGIGIVVNICGVGGNDGARFLVESVLGRILTWSWGGHPRKWRGVHPRKWWGAYPQKRWGELINIWGKVCWWCRWCLDSTSQDTCNL